MEAHNRRLFLHLSALSDDEYKLFVVALKDILDIEHADDEVSSKTTLREADELTLEQRKITTREVRGWLKGRYPSLKSDVVDKILRLFVETPTMKNTIISGGQFLAALRLALHVQNGGEVLEGNVFVQVNLANDTCSDGKQIQHKVNASQAHPLPSGNPSDPKRETPRPVQPSPTQLDLSSTIFCAPRKARVDFRPFPHPGVYANRPKKDEVSEAPTRKAAESQSVDAPLARPTYDDGKKTVIDLTASLQAKEECLEDADLHALLTPDSTTLGRPKSIAPADAESAQLDPKSRTVDGNGSRSYTPITKEKEDEEGEDEKEMACVENQVQAEHGDKKKQAKHKSAAVMSAVNVVNHMKCSNCVSSKQDQCEGPPGRACNRCRKIRQYCDYSSRKRRVSTKGSVRKLKAVKSKNSAAPGGGLKRKRSGADNEELHHNRPSRRLRSSIPAEPSPEFPSPVEEKDPEELQALKNLHSAAKDLARTEDDPSMDKERNGAISRMVTEVQRMFHLL